MKIGVKTKIIGNAKIDPKTVKTIASCALPCRSISCPGRTERKESSSGAPKMMDGLKEFNQENYRHLTTTDNMDLFRYFGDLCQIYDKYVNY